jgi:hypothetical protein
MVTSIRAPIIVVGTHRSGTTLLGRAIGTHPDVAYWEEPREVWSWGHHSRPDDLLTADMVSPRIAAHVKRRFGRFLEQSGRSRFAEKTPSNCLRLEFIREIFPDARFLHIFRDGRAVVHSTDVMTRNVRIPLMEQGPRRLLGTPLRAWPALLPRVWRTLGRRTLGLPMEFWGPQPPGWRDWVRQDPPLIVLAKQWRHTVEPILRFRASQPADQWLDVRYEDLVTRPGRLAEDIEAFAGLEGSASFRDHLVSECRTDRIDAWREHLGADELASLRPVLEPPLRQLGYDW